MQSKAATVAQYLKELPADRRAALEAVRGVINTNLDKGFEEGMQYGMIGWYVPHRVYPAGYHCDPKQPLPFAALASQKNYMSLYLMWMYENAEEEGWLRRKFELAGKKLDMGKCCIRFKKLDDLPMDIISEVVGRATLTGYLERYEKALRLRAKKPSVGAQAAPAKSSKPTAKKAPARKPAPKAGAKKTTRKAAPKK